MYYELKVIGLRIEELKDIIERLEKATSKKKYKNTKKLRAQLEVEKELFLVEISLFWAQRAIEFASVQLVDMSFANGINHLRFQNRK
jgi:hypothetical protein